MYVNEEEKLREQELSRKLGRSFISKVNESLNVVRSPLSKPAKYIRLTKIVGALQEALAPHTPCKKGCSHCCHMAVLVSEHEAKRIAAHTGRSYQQLPAPAWMTDEQSCADFQKKQCDKYIRVPCPFLGGKGECTIYKVRPMVCRTYHTIAPTNEPCKLGMAGERAKEVPMINLTEIDFAHAALSYEGKLGDIREFFPMKEKK